VGTAIFIARCFHLDRIATDTTWCGASVKVGRRFNNGHCFIKQHWIVTRGARSELRVDETAIQLRASLGMAALG